MGSDAHLVLERVVHGVHVGEAVEGPVKKVRPGVGVHKGVHAVAQVLDHGRRHAARVHLEVDAVLERA